MSNEPILKLRDGLITATVWENTTASGEDEKTRLSIELNRSYKDGETWHTTSSFSQAELLKVARLAERTHDAIQDKRSAGASD